MDDAAKHTVIPEILPKAGLVYSEKGNLSEVLCKPKIMPIKSATLEQIEQMEKEFQANLFKHGILQTKLVVAAELVWGLAGAA
mmetsp:Transcript_39362/g.80552  ORF Transcript_39362/g.80552 Transcript_39362/m.80552 type:complete len:83 (-) Transcript_39362:96-344(-)